MGLFGFRFKNFRFKSPGFVYEKASRSSSEDGYASDEAQAFLTQDQRRLVSSTPQKFRVAILSLVCSAILNVLLLGFVAHQYAHRGASSSLFPELVYSPANEVIRYETKIFTSGFGDQRTKYMGDSYEADAEWEKLYPRTVVRIPKSQADKLANKTIPIAGDEDHFPVLITAFHSMHCLDSIRHLYWGHDKNMDVDPEVNDAVLRRPHIDHCFDALRQSIMCSGDLSPVPYNWVPSKGKALGTLGVAHTCRNYEALVEWALEPERDIRGWNVSIPPSTIV
ncbi:hypothetical protein BDV96DRAFT_600787 [Lophiotrema nucula]|uniref:Tat pathway signal sequence n=1 Tax=Lophiotrema nucula TaxID=690887 RepID=A0A6A5Z5A6_9PLEO|nr:hypothetical protein BDV96DRAFT_600787 [Lophiotrema nucula]